MRAKHVTVRHNMDKPTLPGFSLNLNMSLNQYVINIIALLDFYFFASVLRNMLTKAVILIVPPQYKIVKLKKRNYDRKNFTRTIQSRNFSKG